MPSGRPIPGHCHYGYNLAGDFEPGLSRVWTGGERMRLMKAGFVLVALPLVALSAAARTPALPVADPDLEAVIAEARAWVTKPATDRRIEAFSPAVDIRYREYRKPRPLRVWITRVDLTAPGVRLAVTQPLAGEPKRPKEETRSATDRAVWCGSTPRSGTSSLLRLPAISRCGGKHEADEGTRRRIRGQNRLPRHVDDPYKPC